MEWRAAGQPLASRFVQEVPRSTSPGLQFPDSLRLVIQGGAESPSVYRPRVCLLMWLLQIGL
jgi:hypothetical protein